MIIAFSSTFVTARTSFKRMLARVIGGPGLLRMVTVALAGWFLVPI